MISISTSRHLRMCKRCGTAINGVRVPLCSRDGPMQLDIPSPFLASAASASMAVVRSCPMRWVGTAHMPVMLHLLHTVHMFPSPCYCRVPNSSNSLWLLRCLPSSAGVHPPRSSMLSRPRLLSSFVNIVSRSLSAGRQIPTWERQQQADNRTLPPTLTPWEGNNPCCLPAAAMEADWCHAWWVVVLFFACKGASLAPKLLITYDRHST